MSLLLLKQRARPRQWSFWTPYWPSSLWAQIAGQASLTEPTGITHDNTPGDPLGGTLGETWAKFDASGAHGGPGVSNNTPVWGMVLTGRHRGTGFDDTVSAPPDNMRRHSWRRSRYFYADGRPSSDALIMASNSYLASPTTQWAVTYNTDGTFSLIVDGSIVGRSSVAASLTTPYQIDVFEVFNDSNGVRLVKNQWVVRLTTGLGGALTFTDVLNVSVAVPSSLAQENGFNCGEATGRGAFNFWARTLAQGWDDADTPLGLLRNDRLDINGIGHDTQWTTVGAGGSNVDESGTGVPVSGVGEEDTVTPNQDVIVKETYTHGAAHYPVAGDTIISVGTMFRVTKSLAVGKGEVPTLNAILSDGTTDYLANVEPVASNSYQDYILFWLDKPGGTAGWLPSDLANFQVGLRALTANAAGGETYRNADITTLVLYQKAGEDGPALPQPISYPLRRQGNPRQRVRRGDIRRLRAA